MTTLTTIWAFIATYWVHLVLFVAFITLIGVGLLVEVTYEDAPYEDIGDDDLF